MADPEPGRGQVRIAVAASGVHLIDTAIRSGATGGPFPLPELPMTPGREVAGVVDRLGAEVAGNWLGKRVVGHLGQASGGYAQLAVADAASLHELPADVGENAAVAMIGTGRTAVGVLETADLRATDILLVTAAAGGLGSLFVQAGRNAGATVVGLAGGAAKVGLVRALGADVAVDYRDPGWPDAVRAELGGRSPTVLLDGVGGAAGQRAVELLATGGRAVTFGWSAGQEAEVDAADIAARELTITSAIGPRLAQRPGGIRALEVESLASLAEGRLRPVVDVVFPLAEAARAHRALESRGTVGKVILQP